MESFTKKVEKRAYELYLKRGSVDGYDLEDWKQAEKEVKEAEKKAAESKACKEKEIVKPVSVVKEEEPVAYGSLPKAEPKIESSKPVEKAPVKTESAPKTDILVCETKEKKTRASGTTAKKRVTKKKSA